MGLCASKDETAQGEVILAEDPKKDPSTALKVTIKSAKGLRNADWFPFSSNKSDPYCICEIPGKEGTVVKGRRVVTKVNNNDLNPTWDHEGYIVDYVKGDKLLFTVLDRDTVTEVEDDLLGKVLLESGDFWPGGFSGELQLLESGKKQAYLTVTIEACVPPEMEEEPDAKKGAATTGNADPDKAFGITFREKKKGGTLTCQFISKPLGFTFCEGRMPLKVKRLTGVGAAKDMGIKEGMELVAINGENVGPPLKYAQAFSKLSAYIDTLPEPPAAEAETN